MADFRAQYSFGVTLQPWTDPASVAQPTRLNPRAEQGHTRHVGTVGQQIEVNGRVAGILAPLDAALGGRLFTAFFAESATPLAPALTSPPGQSSVQRFTPAAPGHYTLRLVREDGGSIFMHVDVVAP